MNSDGSTSNLSQYIYYCRSTLSRSFKIQYVGYLIWSYLAGVFSYYVAMICFGDIMGADGKVNNLYNGAINAYIANIVAHHIQVVIETNNFSIYILISYLLSMSLLIVGIHNSDGLITETYVGYYYKNQWSVLMTSPLFYLSLIIQVFVIVLPNIINRCFESAIFHPEFSKIKAD